MAPLRVALLTNVLPPYRLPVFRDLAATPGLDLHLLVSAPSEYHWRAMFADGFEAGSRELRVERVAGLSFARRVAVHRESGTGHRVELQLPLGVVPSLARLRPDVIVSAELGLRTALAAGYAAARGVPLVVWSYASRSFHDSASPFQRWRRSLLLARADAVVGMGTQAREVLLDLGVPPARLFDAPNAHDPTHFERTIAEIDREAARAALRGGLGLRENVVLVVGRLVAQKGLAQLLDAWRRVPDAVRADASLLFVGDGPESARVQAAMDSAAPGEIARLAALPPAELPGLYAAADLMIFPSLGDAWGLVVNEALACGVPVLCSTLAGCVEDLIEPGRTGWRFDPTDAPAAAVAIEGALRCDTRASMGQHARERAKRFGPEAMVGGLRRAIDYAAARRRSAVA